MLKVSPQHQAVFEYFFNEDLNFKNNEVRDEAFDDYDLKVEVSGAVFNAIESSPRVALNPKCDLVKLYYADLVDNHSALEVFGDFSSN